MNAEKINNIDLNPESLTFSEARLDNLKERSLEEPQIERINFILSEVNEEDLKPITDKFNLILDKRGISDFIENKKEVA